MKRVFVVRPFKPRDGIDFGRVHRDLIAPAIKRAGLQGDTTLEFVEAGNIRVDMFRLLVTADVVVADLSVHNANVFYELGIRHGLRPRATVMIRSRVEGHDYPFDLQTDRYIEYSAAMPAAALEDLVRALKDAAAGWKGDSPVYLLLPDLKPPDPATLKAVPRDFREEVGIAGNLGRRGDLGLLAYEARGFEWESEGLRVVGRAQFNLEADRGARETFEWLRDSEPADIEANQRLATIYQRLGELARSDLAIQRVIDNPASTRKDLAEVFALRARNLKGLWLKGFADESIDTPRAREMALVSAEIEMAQVAYADAFRQDLNAYYPGINALTLLVLRAELADAQPDVWNGMFESEEAASAQLKTAKEEIGYLTGALRCCLTANRKVLERQSKASPEDQTWLPVTQADFAFLTSTKPPFVAQKYREALSGAAHFAADAVLEQLKIFERLNLRPAMTRAALEVVRKFSTPGGTEAAPLPRHVLLFTGHRVDGAGRETKRFPNTERAEAEARRLIRKAIEDEKASVSGEMLGIAGGASGGDILFHEVCAEMGITTRLFLALPVAQFCARSVQDAGARWVERYHRLVKRLAVRELAQHEELPYWLLNKKDYDIWQRNNLWMLFNALAENGESLTLLALWNGEAGDGPGGTRDLINQTESRGRKTVVLDASVLKELA